MGAISVSNLETAAGKASTALATAKKASNEVSSAFSQASEKFAASGRKWKSAGERIGNVSSSVQKAAGLFVVSGALAVGSAVNVRRAYEDAFVEVAKVTNEVIDANGKVIISHEDLMKSSREMAKTIPASYDDITAAMANAGRLGVPTENIEKFTETVLMLGVSTDLTVEDASKQLARFSTIMGEPLSNVDRLGSSLVDLGNNVAAEESEILNLAMRLAAAGKLAGFTSEEVFGLSASMAAVGITSERGGTAISRTLTQMNTYLREGGEEADLLAKVTGKSVGELQKLWEEDAAGALQEFLKGLNEFEKAGGNVDDVYSELGINAVRQKEVLNLLSLSHEELGENMDRAANAYRSNTALSEEASRKYATFNSRLTLLWNSVKDVAYLFGGPLSENLAVAIEKVQELTNRFGDWYENLQKTNPELTDLIAKISLWSLVLGTAVLALSTFGRMIAFVVRGIGDLKLLFAFFAPLTKIAVALKNISLAAIFVKLKVALLALLSPIGLIVVGVVALIAAVWWLWKNSEKFRDGVSAAFNKVSEVVSIMVDEVVDLFKKMGDRIKVFWDENGAEIMENWQTFWNELKRVGQEVSDSIKEIVNRAQELMRDLWEKHGEDILKAMNTAWNKVQEIFAVAGEVLIRTLEFVWRIIEIVLLNNLDLILKAVEIFSDLLAGDFEGAWEGVQDLFGIFAERFQKIFEEFTEYLSDVWSKVRTLLPEPWAEAFDKVWEIVSWAVNTVGKLLWGLWEYIIKPLGTLIWNIIVTAFKVFWWVATNLVWPAIVGIGKVLFWLWENVLRPVLGFIATAVLGAFKVFSWVVTNIVMPAAAFIGAALMWLLENVVGPVARGIAAFLSGAFAVLSWVWQNVVAPILSKIAVIFTWIWTYILKPILKLIGAAFMGAFMVLGWLWQNMIGPALGWIAKAFKWVWSSALGPVLKLIGLAIMGAFMVLGWVWQNMIGPALGWIGKGFMWLWENAVKPAGAGIAWLWNKVGSVISWVWENWIKPVIDWFGDKIEKLGEIISPVLDGIADGFGWVGDKFKKAGSWISDTWDKVTGDTKEGGKEVKDSTKDTADAVEKNLSGVSDSQRHFEDLTVGASKELSSLEENTAQSTDKISTTASKGMDGLGDIFGEGFAGLDGSGDLFGGMGDSFGEGFLDLSGTSGAGFGELDSTFSEGFSGLDGTGDLFAGMDDSFGEGFLDLSGTSGAGFGGLDDTFSAGLGGLDGTGDLFAGMDDSFGEGFLGLSEATTSGYQEINDATRRGYAPINDTIASETSSLGDTFSAGIGSFGGIADEQVKKVPDSVERQMLRANVLTARITLKLNSVMANSMRNLVRDVSSSMARYTKVIQQGSLQAAKAFSTSIGFLKKAVGQVSLTSAGRSVMTSFVRGIYSGIPILRSVLLSISRIIPRLIPKNILTSAGRAAILSLANGMLSARAIVASSVVRVISGAASVAYARARSALVSAGRAMVQGLAQGMRSSAYLASRAATSVAQQAANSARGYLGIRSPSRLFAGFGEYIDQGLAQGMLRGIPEVKRASARLSAASAQAFGSEHTVSVAYNSSNRDFEASRAVTQSFEANMYAEKQPVVVQLTLGKQDFRGFVEDITSQQKKVTMNRGASIR